MSLTAQKRNEIKEFILSNIREHPKDIVRFTQRKYKLTSKSILNYLLQLNHENKIEIKGNTRDRNYSLKPLAILIKTYQIQDDLAEDKVWRNDIAPLFNNDKENIVHICNYGFTEILNNAIDHSEGTTINVKISIEFDRIIMSIEDNGVGIFNKIQRKYKLDDPLHAILELSKGKLTTDPESHTGEGIFFTSRMFDNFIVFSGKYYFITSEIDFMFEADKDVTGTDVYMEISRNSERTPASVFSKFTDPDSYGFDKTVVPVKLARYGNENLVSRSQAKRLMARLEKFKTVILDFNNVETIGRAFADEIFRVFIKNHPTTKVFAANDNDSIKRLVAEIQNSNSK